MGTLARIEIWRSVDMAELGQSSSGVVATLGRPLSLAGCGALAGIITKTGVAPLERVKLLYQVQGLYGTSQYTSVGQSLRKILAEDGARGFYQPTASNSCSMTHTRLLSCEKASRCRRWALGSCWARECSLDLVRPPSHTL